MPYLGNVPAEAYTNTVKDSFNGDASTTAFTLSQPSTANNLRVVVENVIQDPTVAYTVSGTTLTFTSAPPVGTANIYAVHLGPAVQTVTPPDGVTLTSPTVIGDLTVDTNTLYVDSANNRVGVGTVSPAAKLHLGGSSNQTIQIEGTSNTAYFGTNGNRGDLFVNYDPTNGTIPNSGRSTVGIQLDGADGGSNIVFRTTNANNAASTERMRIDDDGLVTTPYQPSFEAYRTSGNVTTNNSTVVFNNTRHNVGNHYSTSTGYFTAPVAGTYIFTTQAFTNGSSSGVVDIQVNGSSRVRMEADTNVSYRSMFASGIFSLSVNDVVRIWCISQPIHYNTSGLYSNFCGYLLG